MRTVVTIAGVIIILAALKLASTIVVPVLIAATFAIAFQPLTEMLAQHGVPKFVAAILTVLAVLLALGVVGTLVAVAVADLATDAPRYAESMRGLWEGALETLNDMGLGSVAEGVGSTDVGGKVSGIVSAGAKWISGAAGDLLNVLILTVFIQLEATMLRTKLRLISDGDAVSDASKTLDSVQKYFRIRFLLSLMNGVLLGTWCAVWGVSNPLLWGVVAFVMNFVPIIGSLIAAIPPILLALVEHGIGTAAGVLAGYIAVNIVVDNMLEPRLMGRALDISPLVLMLSLLVWGFILGPIGALLSFPLTVAMRIYFEHDESTRWIAIMLAAKTKAYESERQHQVPKALADAPVAGPPNAPDEPPG